MTGRAVGAGGAGVHNLQGVGAASGAFRLVADVEGGAEEVGVGDGVAGVFLLLQGPGGLGTFDLLEVGDAGVFLAGGARLDEVGDRDGRQESDDGHYDHDFHEGETGFVCLADFHFSTFYLS